MLSKQEMLVRMLNFNRKDKQSTENVYYRTGKGHVLYDTKR